MNNHRKIDKMIIGVLMAGFAVICMLSWLSTRPNRQLWAFYSPELTRKRWSEFDQQYLPVTAQEDLRLRIGQQVRQAAHGDQTILARIDPITSLVRGFLAAYGEGSFEKYWNFRVPTGRFEPKPEKSRAIKQLIQDAAKAPGETALGEVAENETRELIKVYWQRSTELGQAESGADHRPGAAANLKSDVRPCAVCFTEFAPASIEVQGFAGGEKMPSLMQIIRAQPNLGVFVYDGCITALPAKAVDARTFLAGPNDFLCVSFLIKSSREGYKHPVYVLAAWDPDSEKYIPLRVGLPSLRRDRAFFIF